MRRGKLGGPEPLARQHARVADGLAAAARELRPASRRSTAGPTSTASPATARTTGRRTTPAGLAPSTGMPELRPPARRRVRRASRAGSHRFAVVTAAATLLLIVAGGLVTSTESGLSVPDWPTTYGYNMFTFPISKWVGGIRFEHTHRLIASTVGLLTVVLAIWLARRESRALGPPAGLPRRRRGRRAGCAGRPDGAVAPAARRSRSRTHAWRRRSSA